MIRESIVHSPVKQPYEAISITHVDISSAVPRNRLYEEPFWKAARGTSDLEVLLWLPIGLKRYIRVFKPLKIRAAVKCKLRSVRRISPDATSDGPSEASASFRADGIRKHGKSGSSSSLGIFAARGRIILCARLASNGSLWLESATRQWP